MNERQGEREGEGIKNERGTEQKPATRMQESGEGESGRKRT